MIMVPSISELTSRKVYLSILWASVATKVTLFSSTLINTPIIACLISSLLVANSVLSIPAFIVLMGISTDWAECVSDISGNYSYSSQASLYSTLIDRILIILDTTSFKSLTE